MTKDEILNTIRAEYERVLGNNLVGIYIHGSVAFGCFDPRVSDIDFLVVIDEPLTVARKMALLAVLTALEPVCPPKGLEMSVVLARDCKPFVYPTPYQLHFSADHLARAKRDPVEYCSNFHGVDRDLAAHMTVTRAVGHVLCGVPIDEVFGEVPHEAYLDSIRYDVENAVEEIDRHPVYVILNLCRVVAYLRDGMVLSKKEGGEWGLAHLPPHDHDIILAALAAYTDNVPYHGDRALARAFAAVMCAEIFDERAGIP